MLKSGESSMTPTCGTMRRTSHESCCTCQHALAYAIALVVPVDLRPEWSDGAPDPPRVLRGGLVSGGRGHHRHGAGQGHGGNDVGQAVECATTRNLTPPTSGAMRPRTRRRATMSVTTTDACL